MNLAIWKKSEHDRNCLISIDSSVWGSLSEKALRTLLHYQVGSYEITESDAGFIQDELLRNAWHKLLDWLAKQEHSSSEAREYLKKHSFHPSIIEHCLQEAVSKNFINDERYARLLIESLIVRNKSPQEIRTKLIEKRLPSALWEPLLAELYRPTEQKSSLAAQAEKVYLRYKHLEKHACYEKCLTAIYRKGFDLDDAREVVAGLVYRNK
jgi:SOS response regulatory protein OraA/RecX